MKIKAICEATGLTDRTIRYYIEEELITPSYTENYLGRKTFDFTESDVQQLKDIAVLRKYGFSISEIKKMSMNPEEIIRITHDLQKRKRDIINEEGDLLQALLRLDMNNAYTVSHLAACLSIPVLNATLPANDEKQKVFIVKSLIKSILILGIIWLPVVLSVLVLMSSIHRYQFPVFRPFGIVLTIVTLLPTILSIVLPKIKITAKWKSVSKYILLVLCALSIPVSTIMSLGIVTHSETTDFVNYRDFDSDCLANRDMFFQELFPIWPHYFVDKKQADGSWETVYLDAHYLYRNLPAMDYTYDIYAEWPLEENAFVKEVDRVIALFEAYAPAKEDRNKYHDYVTVQKGNYTCLILYHSYGGDSAFEEVTDSYTYYIFAYDKKNLKVRYIYCRSLENGADQPYYLSLKW